MCRPFIWWSGGISMPCGSPLGIISSSQNFKIMIDHKWGNLSFGIGGANKSWVSYGLADNKVNNVPNIFAFRADSSKLSIRLNGKKVAETPTASSIIPSKEPYSVWIGYASGDVGSPTYSHYKGWIGEIIVIRRPIGDDIMAEVENYLSKKWKINLSN